MEEGHKNIASCLVLSQSTSLSSLELPVLGMGNMWPSSSFRQCLLAWAVGRDDESYSSNIQRTICSLALVYTDFTVALQGFRQVSFSSFMWRCSMNHWLFTLAHKGQNAII